MSSMKSFLKANKKVKPNIKYVVSENFVDEEGNPLEWELKPLSARDNERIKDECTTINQNQPKVDIKAMHAKQVVASVVFPDLHNKDLQNSYGVMGAEDLLFAMVDEAGDYQNFVMFVLKYNRLNVSLDAKIEEAKN